MAYQIPLTIKETLEGIAQNKFVLPAIQRELVWAQEPERMTRLFDSILRGYPIGTFLFWKVTPEQSKQFHFYEFMLHWHQRKHRHNDRLHLAEPRELTAILDGQQRLTTLNIGLYGSLAHKLPRKRVDSVDAYPPKQLHLDLRYVPNDVDDLQYGLAFLTEGQAADRDGHHWDRVSDIFVRVNSGGVVLTKSDLLLSIATAQFEGRDAREEIHGLVDDLNDTEPGFRFTKVSSSRLVWSSLTSATSGSESRTSPRPT